LLAAWSKNPFTIFKKAAAGTAERRLFCFDEPASTRIKRAAERLSEEVSIKVLL